MVAAGVGRPLRVSCISLDSWRSSSQFAVKSAPDCSHAMATVVSLIALFHKSLMHKIGTGGTTSSSAIKRCSKPRTKMDIIPQD